MSIKRNLVQTLIAVLAGNAAYFLLMPYLPPAAQHRVFHKDWGPAVAFLFCLVALGVVKMATNWWDRGWGRKP